MVPAARHLWYNGRQWRGVTPLLSCPRAIAPALRRQNGAEMSRVRPGTVDGDTSVPDRG
jgi:hypothetical protein